MNAVRCKSNIILKAHIISYCSNVLEICWRQQILHKQLYLSLVSIATLLNVFLLANLYINGCVV
jgi:hypothetical protein